MVLNDLSWPWHTIKGSGQGSHPALRRPTGRNISYLVLLEDVAVSFTASTWCIRSSADLQGVQVHPVWSKGGLWMIMNDRHIPTHSTQKACSAKIHCQWQVLQAVFQISVRNMSGFGFGYYWLQHRNLSTWPHSATCDVRHIYVWGVDHKRVSAALLLLFGWGA